MWVKICGITRLEDALLAAGLGADAVGFVFWPGSRRFIDPAAAGAIVATLPRGVVPVGVFVDQPVEHIETVVREVGLGAVQLHGSECPEYLARLTAPVIKAVAAGPGFCASAIADLPPSVTVLLDADDRAAHGGTGRTADWTAAARVARLRRTILAGGLAPENVAAAIRAVRPYGVDVSSGVEARDGIKDAERLRSFLDAVRACAAGVRDDEHSR